MATDRPIILLTGFGPFPSVPANATSVLVPRLAAAAADVFAGSAVVHEILPTEWHAGLARASQLYRQHRPVLALHFGVSSRANGFEIETRGRNYCSAALDAAGLLPPLDRISLHGPEFLPASLPAAHIVQRLRRRGIPAVVSRDAGGYLCNALLYRTAELARSHPAPMRSGFIHLPSDLVNERNPARGPMPSCRLAWRDVVDGGLEIIAASLGKAMTPIAPRPMARRLASG